MTTTTIISAVSFGTSTNVGDFFNAVKTTLQAATTAAQIVVSVTRGTSVPEGTMVGVYFAVSPVSYASALEGAKATMQGAQLVQVPLKANQATVEVPGELLVTAAGYSYCWVQAPMLSVASTVTVNLQELP